MTNQNDQRGSMSDLERTLERVRKLLAIAQDERANPHEAAAAAHQAEVVMRKFQIAHADVVEVALKKGDAFDVHYSSSEMKRTKRGSEGYAHKAQRNPGWAQWLHTAIAKLHDVQSRQVHRPEFGVCLSFSGYKADVQIAGWTFDFLANAMIAGTRRWQKEGTRTKSESESFRRGFILQLTAELRKFKAEKDAEMQKASASRSLVIVKDQLVAEHFGSVKYTSSKTTIGDTGAYMRGREEGAKVNVRQGALGGSAAPVAGKLR